MKLYKISLLYAIFFPIVALIFAVVVNPAATIFYVVCLIIWYVIYFMPCIGWTEIKHFLMIYPNAVKRAWELEKI